jgi:hypothetical protein
MEHWWKLDLLQKLDRWSSVFIALHASVVDVTSVKQADLQKYVLRGNVTGLKVCLKNQN